MTLVASALFWTALTLFPAVSVADGPPISEADSLSQQITELRLQGEFTAALEAARSLPDALREDPRTRAWAIDDAERLIAALEHAAGLPEDTQQELVEADRLTAEIGQSYRRGEYALGVRLAERQLAIRRRHLGERHPDVAKSLADLGNSNARQGKYPEAEAFYEQALAITEELLGPEHPTAAGHLNNLANLCKDQDRDDEAEQLFERALAISEAALGPDHRDVARSLNGLGILYWQQGRYPEAETLYKRAMTRAGKWPAVSTS